MHFRGEKYKNLLGSTFSILIYSLLFLFSVQGFSQGEKDTDIEFKKLCEKSAEFHRKTDGEMEGYRVKIHFGNDKLKAREVKQKFAVRFPEYPAYEEYRQPDFVIVIGDFRTRVLAYAAYKKVMQDFPNSFIIKCRIKSSK